MTAPVTRTAAAGRRDDRATPVRMRLSRRKGFDLQAESRALNGLPAVKVTRPGIWGNPFTVTRALSPGSNIRAPLSGGYIAVPTVEDAVDCYEAMMAAPAEEGERAPELRKHLPSLRGRNLACWCPLSAPDEPDRCHAAVLLRLANIDCADPAAHPPDAPRIPSPSVHQGA